MSPGAALVFRGPWAAEERAWVEATWGALPEPLRVPAVVVVGHPVDGDAPDALVAVAGHHLRVAPHADDAVRTRALVHAFVHIADHDAGWSTTSRWRSLSGWGALGGRPAESAPFAYVDPAARRSAAEDLAWTVTSTLDAVAAPPSADDDPRCRLPSKVRYLAEVGIDVAPRDCPGFEDVGLEAETLELVYASGSTRSVASVAGHLLVALTRRDDAGLVHRDTYALVANAHTPLTPVDALAALVGGTPSRIVSVPYASVVAGYAWADDRDVRRYALVLDDAQRARFLGRLDELRQGWDRPYVFLTRNCTALPVELLRAALGEAWTPSAIESPEAVLGELDRLGLLRPEPVERVEELGRGVRARAARGLVVAAARTTPALRGLVARSATARIAAYHALPDALPADVGTLVAADEALAWADRAEPRARHAPGADPSSESPALAALRDAKAQVRTRALAAGAGLASFGGGDDALVDATAVPRETFGSHSPLQVWSVDGGVRDGVAWGGFESALYDSAVGEPRRYAAGSTAGYTALRAGLAVTADGTLRLDGLVFSVHTLVPTVGPLGLGAYGDVLALDAWDVRTGESTTRWGEAGGLLGLWSGRPGTPLGWVSVGLALDTRGERDAAWTGRVGLEGPVGLHVALPGPRHALTTTGFDLRWAPRLTLDGRVRADTTARWTTRVRVASVAGADVALQVRADGGRVDGAWTWDAQGGVVVEPR